MIDAHKVVDYIKEHFNQDDTQIVLILSQGVLMMKDIQLAMMKNREANIQGFDDVFVDVLDSMDAYLSDILEEEMP